jgi:winged helix DNA-binding protein
MGGEVLSRRELNRATLARQMLLERRAMPVIDAVRHLVGLQSQAPDAPYVGLWCRLAEFDPSELSALTRDRDVVRLGVMRSTVHVVTAADALQLRPLVQPVLDRDFKSQIFKRNLEGVDVDAVRARGVALLEEQPRTRAELGRLLAVDWPDRDPASLAYAVSYLEPLVQVPPRGLWRAGGAAAHTTLPHWLGRPLDPAPSIDDVVLRYLAAFGPASVLDVQAWCGLTRLGEVVDRLRPQLRPFRNEDGRELFDLPDAPRPEPDVPAPPRFLPEYDNLLLSYADRRRCIPDGRKVPLYPGNGARFGELLLDGTFQGTWRLDRDNHTAHLQVEPFAPLSADDATAVEAEAQALLDFAAPDHHHEILVLG